MKDINTESINKLFDAILSLETEEECRKFFEDICTIKEIEDMGQRLETAVLLDQGVNYNTISKQVGTSAATISRVSRCLNYGNGGYKIVIDKMKAKKDEEVKQ